MRQPIAPISELSFPDESVRTWSWSEKALDVTLSGAHCCVPMPIPVFLRISQWHSFGARQYSDQGWVALEGPFEPLTEICEAVFEADKTILRGFGQQSGMWIEYTFVAGHCDAWADAG